MRGISLSIALFFVVESVSALPLPTFTYEELQKYGLHSEPSRGQKAYRFAGIVALSNCSGSLIRFESSVDTDKALVLTNGHCVRLLEAKEVIHHKASSRTFYVLNDSAQDIGRLKAEELVYATMHKTDMAIYRVTKTYEEIRNEFQVEALTLSSTPPTIESGIEVLSGYWRRGYSCKMEAEIFQMKEDIYEWSSSIRYSRPGCETIGGTSGSPVILEGTRTVVGVNNTGNESGEECTLNNPCEIDAEGNKSFVQGYSYAQQTHWVYSCLTENRDIDPTIEGCQLPKAEEPEPLAKVVPLPRPTH